MTGPRLGIDLGGTKIEAVIIAPDGQEQKRLRRPTPPDNYPLALEQIAALCNDIESACGITDRLPLGIGTPGTVSKKTGLMKNCNSTCLNGQSLVRDLEAVSGRRVRVANDANCFTLSEATDGAGKGAEVVFGVILGTGVGGGISAHQTLLQGINGISGEWGHVPLPLNAFNAALPLKPGRQCYCGRRDCIESWLSGPAFERSYTELSQKQQRSVDIATLARNGEGHARQCLELYVNLLALGLATVINIVDPDVIVMGGGMSNIDELIDGVSEHLPTYVFSDRVDTRLAIAAHGDSSGVRGAAWLWKSQ